MIDKFHLRNFKAHRDTEVPLGRFTVLVGDNASGKTSVLDALWLQAALAKDVLFSALRGDHLPEDLLARGAGGPLAMQSGGMNNSGLWQTSIEMRAEPSDQADHGWRLSLRGQEGGDAFASEIVIQPGVNRPAGPDWRKLGTTVGAAGLYQFRAEKIAAAAYSPTIETHVQIDGTNTAVVLATMKLGNAKTFDRVEVAMRRLIPAVNQIGLRPAIVQWPPGSDREVVGSKIYFDFVGASGVPAQHASHGTLIVLSLLTVLYGANRPSLILLDDFDHALHPRAQMELVQMIKEMLALDEFRDVQVVATTHSPYVLDRLEPSDVHVFALRDDGTVASKRLSAHAQAGRMKGALTAGQLWSLDDERKWVLKE